MTKDQTSAHNTITLEKFAKRVTNAVGRFLEVSIPPGTFRGHGRPLTTRHSDWRRRPSIFGRRTQTGELATEGSRRRTLSSLGLFMSRREVGSRSCN